MMQSWTHSNTAAPDSSRALGNLSKTDILRGIITEKLSTAAREILAVVERTVADYEEEASGFRQEIDRQRRQLEVFQPEIKIEPADDQELFSLSEAGGREVLEEEQQKYILRVEDSESLGIFCNAEEPMEEGSQDDAGEEQQLPEQENEETSLLLPPVVEPHRKSDSRTQASNPEEYVLLKIRILEDSEIEVLSLKIFKKYRLHKLKCPCGLQEADFVNLLKSTFPKLAGERPYDLFIADKHKKLLPLSVESFTPEQVCMAMGNSSLYIRLKSLGEQQTRQKTSLQNGEDEDDEEEEEKSDDSGAEEPLSTHHVIPQNSIKHTPVKECPKHQPPETNSNSQIKLRIRILEDSNIHTLAPSVFRKYRFHHLVCPSGLQEADFFRLLRSTYSQLAGDQPFSVLVTKGRQINPLGVRTVTPEEIARTSRSTGSPAIFIRLEPRANPDTTKKPDAAAEDPPSTPDPLPLESSRESDERASGRPPNSESHHVDLRIRILEDPSIDVLTPTVYQKYPLLELQCPVGLTEEGFLDLLKSTFPQLADEAFDFLTGHGRKIWPMKAEGLTPETISKAIKTAGNTVLYIRLKGQEDDQDSAKKQPSSFSHQTKVSMSVKPAVSTENGAGYQSFQVPSSTSRVDEDLRRIILRALPMIPKETQQALVQKLLNIGLETIEDLNYVKPEDLRDLLPAIHLQRLFQEFIKEINKVTSGPEIPRDPPLAVSKASGPTIFNPSILFSLPKPEASSSDCRLSSLVKQTWPETFQVPWNLMPADLCKAVAVGKRPSPAARRSMIRILVDEMRKHDLNPKRSHCLTICKTLIRQYPQSFADLHDGEKLLGDGCTSLVNQLKNRIENLNRSLGLRQYHASGNRLKRGLDDTYGCTQFQPDLPQDETNETIEKKRQCLEEIYGRDGADGAEGEEVQQLMEATFCLQRRHINALPEPTIANLKMQWPYLFTQKGLYDHFESLTEVRVLRALEMSMEDCGKGIVEFFINKPTNADVKAVLSQLPNLDRSFCVIQLLMAHFSEKLDGLILFASASSTAADVERTLALPTSPRLILLGSDETPGSHVHRWMISIEGQVVCEGKQSTFLSGLAAVFSTYYTFNLQYEEGAVCTLEFIQRQFVGINPGRGSKAGREKLSKLTGKVALRKRTPVNPHVLSLLQKLMDYNSPRNHPEEGRKVLNIRTSDQDGDKHRSSRPLRSSLTRKQDAMSDGKDIRKQNGNHEPEKLTDGNIHIKNQFSDNGDSLLSCRVCQLLRGSMSMLTKHAWSHVGGLNKLCGVCGDQSESAEELRKHLQTHQKTHSCNICGKSFLTNAGFKGHMDVHKGNKPHKCKICHKAFAVKSVLKNHQLVHMTDKCHKCDTCQQSFVSLVKLKIHRLSHEDGKINPSQQTSSRHAVALQSGRPAGVGRLHSCEICGRKFSTDNRLRAHLRKHKKKMFTCPTCSKTFMFKSCLISHMNSHTDKSYKCNVCSVVFSHHSSWRKHQKDHKTASFPSC